MTNNTVTTGSYTYNNYCMYRLPCGYCTAMSRPCAMPTNNISAIPTWDTDWYKKWTCLNNSNPEDKDG